MCKENVARVVIILAGFATVEPEHLQSLSLQGSPLYTR